MKNVSIKTTQQSKQRNGEECSKRRPRDKPGAEAGWTPPSSLSGDPGWGNALSFSSLAGPFEFHSDDSNNTDTPPQPPTTYPYSARESFSPPPTVSLSLSFISFTLSVFPFALLRTGCHRPLHLLSSHPSHHSSAARSLHVTCSQLSGTSGARYCDGDTRILAIL